MQNAYNRSLTVLGSLAENLSRAVEKIRHDDLPEPEPKKVAKVIPFARKHAAARKVAP